MTKSSPKYTLTGTVADTDTGTVTDTVTGTVTDTGTGTVADTGTDTVADTVAVADTVSAYLSCAFPVIGTNLTGITDSSRNPSLVRVTRRRRW